jgi:hypothetical protein
VSTFKVISLGSPLIRHKIRPGNRRNFGLNDNVVFCVKYSGTGRTPWTFGFSAREVAQLAADPWPNDERFAVLVCGQVGICALDRDDLLKVLAVERVRGTQWIEVTAPRRKSFRVRGIAGSLGRLVARNAFPERLFQASKDARR